MNQDLSSEVGPFHRRKIRWWGFLSVKIICEFTIDKSNLEILIVSWKRLNFLKDVCLMNNIRYVFFFPKTHVFKITLVPFQTTFTTPPTIPTNPSLFAVPSLAPLFFDSLHFGLRQISSSMSSLHGQGGSKDADDGTPKCDLAGITADFDQLLAKSQGQKPSWWRKSWQAWQAANFF